MSSGSKLRYFSPKRITLFKSNLDLLYVEKLHLSTKKSLCHTEYLLKNYKEIEIFRLIEYKFQMGFLWNLKILVCMFMM